MPAIKEVKVLPHIPVIKSSIKRAELAAKRRQLNAAKRSALRTSVKKAASSIAAGEVDLAKSNLNMAIIDLDKAASQGLIHKNQAARRKSRLSKKLNALTTAN